VTIFNQEVDICRFQGIFNHMVERNSERLNAVFAALADPTRRALLQRLGDGPLSVGELAAPLAMSLAAASKHIQVLERAGLIQREVQGRVHSCRLDARPLHAGLEWIRHYEGFWERSLDALAERLAAEDAARPAARRKAGAARRRG
jgi:DNA-binding transcriptional ArsR family regulator